MYINYVGGWDLGFLKRGKEKERGKRDTDRGLGVGEGVLMKLRRSGRTGDNQQGGRKVEATILLRYRLLLYTGSRGSYRIIYFVSYPRSGMVCYACKHLKKSYLPRLALPFDCICRPDCESLTSSFLPLIFKPSRPRFGKPWKMFMVSP